MSYICVCINHNDTLAHLYHYYYNSDVFPKGVVPHNSDSPLVEILVSDAEFVRSGDSIVRFHFIEKYHKTDLGHYDLITEYDGYVCGAWWKANERVQGVSTIHNVLLLSISTEPLDGLQYRFPSVYTVPPTKEDSLTAVFFC